MRDDNDSPVTEDRPRDPRKNGKSNAISGFNARTKWRLDRRYSRQLEGGTS